MQAVILAAGEGTRLKPFTLDMPKVMIPVGNKPILEYVVEALAKNGVTNIVMVIGYKKESILNHFGNGRKWKVNIDYAVQEKQLGTGHALLQAKEKIRSDEFILLPGDNIIDDKAISGLIKSRGNSVLIEESNIPSKYGVVEIEGNMVLKLIEKPEMAESNLISTGIYKFSREIFDLVEQNVKDGRNKLTDALQPLIEQGKLNAIKLDGMWRDAIYPWNLLELNAKVMISNSATIAGKIERNVTIKGNVVIGENSIIHSGTYIEGPVIIGEGCEIGPNACIFPSTSIGNNVVIHPFSEIRNSIIMDNTKIGSCSNVTNSVIGKGNSISSHLSVLSGDSLIKVNGDIQMVERVGAFIGGGCEIGANVVIEPGKIIGKGCKISSNKLIRENLPDGSMVM